MNLNELIDIVKKVCPLLQIQPSESVWICPTKREMVVCRIRDLSDSYKTVTLLGLAVDYLFMGMVKKELESKGISIFSDTVDKYHGEVFVYISIKI